MAVLGYICKARLSQESPAVACCGNFEALWIHLHTLHFAHGAVAGRNSCSSVCSGLTPLLVLYRDFVAFVGAIGFTPMNFILPILLWQKVGKHSAAVSIINWAIIIFYSIIAILGAVGSVQAIVNEVASFSLFADLF